MRRGTCATTTSSRFGTLGYVKGTVIGFVGDTGDAEGGPTEDHVEWHPWVVPTPLHEAPSGFSRVMDAIDPFPFLNDVCNGQRVRGSASASSEEGGATTDAAPPRRPFGRGPGFAA